MRSKYIQILFLSLIIFSGLSCNIYSFRGNNPPEGIKTIAVPLIDDQSGFSESGLREIFTDLLKNKISGDNTFLIADKNTADAILYCTIKSIKDEALVISGNENVTKRKITISVSVRFENLLKKRLISERQYDNWGEYNSSSASFSERKNGISTATDKICEDIVTDITSNW